MWMPHKPRGSPGLLWLAHPWCSEALKGAPQRAISQTGSARFGGGQLPCFPPVISGATASVCQEAPSTSRTLGLNVVPDTLRPLDAIPQVVFQRLPRRTQTHFEQGEFRGSFRVSSFEFRFASRVSSSEHDCRANGPLSSLISRIQL